MEGSRKYRAKIDKLVKQRTKFKILDKVRIRGTKLMGFIHTIGSITDIKDVNSTKVQYLVHMDGDLSLKAYYDNEIQLVNQFEEPEKVQFT